MLGGDQCNVYNYSYPWQDNFCESRSRSNGFCPSDRGHQGQDIRPAQCPRETAQAQHAVAAADGYISHIGSISVKLRDETGRTYWYLHLRHWESCDLSQLTTPDQCNSGQLASVCTASALNVEVGDTVSQGDVLGEVSDWFGIEWRGGQCRPSLTTDHLHFEIWDTFSPDGSPTATAVRVPPYSSLVTSYLRAIGADEAHMPDWDTLEDE
jgi:murein DD-endopeptidase MepM/ murein hydrolase activator NlpD